MLHEQEMLENVISKLIVMLGSRVVSTKSSSLTWTDKKSWNSITKRSSIITLLMIVTEKDAINCIKVVVI